MGLRQVLQSKRDEILRIAAKHGAYNVRVFGSVARGDDDEKSDVDFLVRMEDNRSLMDLAALLADLEALLGRAVDLAPEEDLRPKLKDRILRDAVLL